MNTSLNEQLQKLTNEFRIKQEEFQQIEKSLNKQVKHFFQRGSVRDPLATPLIFLLIRKLFILVDK